MLTYLFIYLFIYLSIYLFTYSLFVSCKIEHKAPRFSFFVQFSLYVCPQHFRQSSPIFNFILSSVHWGRIQDIEFERHGLPLPVRCMGQPFKVRINYFDWFVLQRVTFCFGLFSKLSLATITSVDACLCLFWRHLIMMAGGQGM